MTFLALIRSKVAQWLAVLAGIAIAVVAIRRDAVKDERQRERLKDAEKANDIANRAAASRRLPDDGRGYRD